MAASPHLSRKLQDALGQEAGNELTGILDRAANDISELRGDVAELRHQMDVGFTRVDTRFEQLQGRMEAMFAKGLRDQTRFFFLAWAVILAAMIGLYAR
jgi:hypothetical protein